METLKFNRIFTDGGVLLRDSIIRVFGKCDSDDEITVSFDGASKKAEIKDGKFYAEFEPHSAGTGYSLSAKGKENEVTLSDISVGEVWIAGGQSNMELSLEKSASGIMDIAMEKELDIRYITINENNEGWRTVDEDNATVTAVGYYFAKALKNKLDVPVGIINMNKGATSVFHWMPVEAGLENSVTEPYVKRNLYDFGGVEFDTVPEPYCIGASFERVYGCFFEEWVKAIEGFNVRGVLWYQGEADAAGKEGAEIYKTAFPLMVSQWKKCFKNEKLPFITTVLGGYAGEWIGGKNGKAWAYMREAQVEISEENENIYAISAADCGDDGNIHPLEKQIVGKRMAGCALSEIYGIDIPYKSPKFDKAVLNGNTLTVYFKDTYGSVWVPNSELFGFEVKDLYRVWHPLTGKLQGQCAVFDVSGIFKPQYVRASFINGCDIRIFNKYGNPLFSFGNKKITLE